MYQVDENTVALLHFENGFTDECGTTWSAVGEAQINTENKKIGEGALYLPKNAYLKGTNENFKFGSSDFTIDFWVYGADINAKHYGFVSSMATTSPLGVLVSNDVSAVGTSSSGTFINPTTLLPNDVWTHIALVRYSGKLSYYVQGTLVESKDISNSASVERDTFVIGARYVTGQYPTLSPTYIDELRISNIARWTEDFTPGEDPTEPVDPPAEPTDNVLLRITMTDSSEREYKLSKEELNKFISWMDRPANEGTSFYTFDKTITESKEYLVFDKIISFDVKEV